MQLKKWTALALATCALLSMTATGLADAPESEDVQAEVGLAESVDAATGLTVDDGAETQPQEETVDAAIDTAAADEGGAMPGDGGAIDVPPAAASVYYAEVAADDAAVYRQAEDWEAAALLHLGDVVLVTGAAGNRVAVAFYADGNRMTGYMNALDVLTISGDAMRAYLDAAAASDSVALYDDDLNWPLAPLANVVYGDDRAVLASSNYTDYGIDKVFTMNGKEVCASMVPDTGSGNCWKWAQGIYSIVWGCRFSENFKGNDTTGLNLLMNLNDAQRTLTPAHLKAFIQNTRPGATIRVCACSSSCASFNNDGLKCGHKGHSLIVVDRTDDGVITMDSHSGSQHTRFYSWQGFCNAWKGYTYVKYIKWPGAQPLPANAIAEDGSSVAVTDVTLSQTSLTLTVGETATLTATVLPVNATNTSVTWASTDTAVAGVSGGVVTALKAGTASVGVRTSDGGKTATCTVTVKNPVVQKALTRTGNNGTVVLAIGEQMQLSADFATSRGWQLKQPKSSKPKYASIDGTGLVTALRVGKTKITVTTKNKKKATLTVKVVDPNVPAAVALNRSGTIRMKVGDTLKLEASILPTTATTTFAWKSSKAKVAAVDGKGNVRALRKGSCTIAVRTANGKIAKVKIKVSK